MKNYKFYKLSNTKRLRYLDNYYKKKLYVIFLPGFMSDIEGKKPQALFRFAKKNKLGFLSLETSILIPVFLEFFISDINEIL